MSPQESDRDDFDPVPVFGVHGSGVADLEGSVTRIICDENEEDGEEIQDSGGGENPARPLM